MSLCKKIKGLFWKRSDSDFGLVFLLMKLKRCLKSWSVGSRSKQ